MQTPDNDEGRKTEIYMAYWKLLNPDPKPQEYNIKYSEVYYNFQKGIPPIDMDDAYKWSAARLLNGIGMDLRDVEKFINRPDCTAHQLYKAVCEMVHNHHVAVKERSLKVADRQGRAKHQNHKCDQQRRRKKKQMARTSRQRNNRRR